MLSLTTWWRRSQLGWLGGKIPTNQSTQRVTYPDGVWQMFKQQYMPHWFTRKFPVRNKEVVVTTVTNHYFVCPSYQRARQRQQAYSVHGHGISDSGADVT
jgi:hypothetical protein